MKARIVVAASLLAVVPAMTSALADTASAAQHSRHGSWSFADYTPDPSVLAARQALYATTGKADTSYCHGGRVPAAPQDVTAHRLAVSAPSDLEITATAAGAWGFEVDNSRGDTLVGAANDGQSSSVTLGLGLRRGTYVVRSCNLGGAPTAQMKYRLTRAR
jgi:hypothetical protein